MNSSRIVDGLELVRVLDGLEGTHAIKVHRESVIPLRYAVLVIGVALACLFGGPAAASFGSFLLVVGLSLAGYVTFRKFALNRERELCVSAREIEVRTHDARSEWRLTRDGVKELLVFPGRKVTLIVFRHVHEPARALPLVASTAFTSALEQRLAAHPESSTSGET